MDVTFYVLLVILVGAGILYWFLFMRSKSPQEKEELGKEEVTDANETPQENNNESGEEAGEDTDRTAL